MNNSKLGLAIRALWYLGQAVCDNHLASLAVQSFGRTDRQQLRQNVDLMPAWMHKYFLDLTSRRIEMKPCTN